MSELPALSNLIKGYPIEAPQTGAELILTEDDELVDAGLCEAQVELVSVIRHHLRSAAVSRGLSAQLGSAQQVESALLNGDLATMRKNWVTYPLDKTRRRSFVAFSSSASRTVRLRTGFVPTPDQLTEKVPLTEGGTYLIIWGGSPKVLDIEDVRKRLWDLTEAYPIGDVIFHQKARAGLLAKTWSLREGAGSCANDPLEFPNPDLLKEVKLWN